MAEQIPILPDWTRWSWSSQNNRDFYAPLFQDYSSTFQHLERLAVVEGVRSAAWQFITPNDLVTTTQWCHERGLVMVPTTQTSLGQSYSSGGGGPQGAGGNLSYRVVITKPKYYKQILPWNDNDKIGRLLGYPKCCRKAFDQTWAKGQVDSTYEQIQATDWSKPVLASTLWRWLGVRLVPHLPCSYSCEASNQIANDYLTLGHKYHYIEQMQFAKTVLALPLKWSRVFGIAEIKTPIVKVSTRSDWTPKMQRHDKQGVYTKVDPTLWTDNGFANATGMRYAHDGLLAALRQLVPENGRVLDLGCGNGYLLRRLKLTRPDVVLAGVDTNADAIGRIPLLTGQWYADTIQSLVWEKWNPCAVLINPARLLEMTPEDAERTREALQKIPMVFVYCYSDIKSLEQVVTDAQLGTFMMITKLPAIKVGVLTR